jgi:tyrosinase
MGVRKNQASLTAAERAAFVAALKALKANGTYDAFVAQHRAAFMAAPNDPAHGGPGFLPWHREYLRRFERALEAIDPNVSIPYWDWTVDNSPTAPLWAADFMGGNGSGPNQQVTTGPFAHATGQWTLTVLDPGETRPFLRRAFGAMGQLPTSGQVQSANGVIPYDSAPWNRFSNTNTSFRNRLEGVIHNPGHMWVGGSMMDMSSPNDPVFWLHHCNVDRLWAVWQQTHPTQGYLPPSGTPGVVAGHALDDPMPPWAGEAVPPTPRSVLNHHALGYRYDTDPPVVGQPHYLSYKSITGAATIDRIKPDGQGSDTIWNATWSRDWSHFMPFQLGDQTYYLSYKTIDGSATIDRIKPDGQGSDTIWNATWARDWSHFMPFQLL